jgi:acetyl-CoA acetyltransferase
MAEAFICDYVRTPIGRFGGALAAVRADDLAAVPLKALLARHERVDWAALDDVVLGCANQAGEDNRNVARMALLLAGVPKEVPGSTVNRLCGSGMDALLIAARAIRAGEAELLVAGGVESMSRAPFVMPKAEMAYSRRAEWRGGFAQACSSRARSTCSMRRRSASGCISAAWCTTASSSASAAGGAASISARSPARRSPCTVRPR